MAINNEKSISFYKEDNSRLLKIILDKTYSIEYDILLDVHLLTIIKTISFNGKNLKSIYEVLSSNKQNLSKMEYSYHNMIIAHDEYINPNENMTISYSIIDFNKEKIEVAYINRNVVN